MDSYETRNAVAFADLSAADRLLVGTRNHAYEIIVASPECRTVCVKGGAASPTFILADLLGSVRGGCLMPGTALAVGHRAVLATQDGRWLVTSAIESIAVARAA